MGKKKRNKQNRAEQPKESKTEGQHSMLPALIFICSLLALATPLLPSSAPSIPVTLTQAAVFQALVAVMLGMWLPLAVTSRRYRPRWDALAATVLAFGAMMLISLAFSADGDLSFWSQLWRMTGVWNMLHYVVWFLVLSSVIQNKKDWRIFLSASCLFALFAGLYGLKQWIASPLSASVLSTLGNQSLLAAYVLPHIFIAGYLSVDNRSWTKYFYYLVMVVCALTVIVSASRGAVLALVISVSVALAALVALSSWPKRRRLVVAAVLFSMPALFVSAALLMRLPAAQEAVMSRVQVPRFISRVVYRDIGADRKLLWSYAWRGFVERPVFGWGNEMYGYLYDHYFDHEGEDKIIFNERWQDRAHNQYLDILVSYGLIGMLSFLAMWLAVATKLWRSFVVADDAADRKRLAMLAVFGICYLTYILTIFDTPAQLTVVFAVLALIAAWRTRDVEEQVNKNFQGLRIVLLTLLLPASLFVVWIDMAPVARAAKLHDALIQIRSDRQDMRSLFSDAFKWPNAYVHGMRYAAVFETQKYMELAQLHGVGMQDGIEYLAEQAVDSAEKRPLSSRYLIGASTAMRLLALDQPEALDEAERYAQKVIDLMPGRFDGYAEMAEAAILRGDFNRAIALLEDAEERVYVNRPDLNARINMLLATAHAGRHEFGPMVERLQLAGKQDQTSYFDARLAIILSKSIRPGDDISGVDVYLNQILERYSQVPTVNQAVNKIIEVSKIGAAVIDVGTISSPESTN